MRLSTTHAASRLVPVLAALTWGVCAAQSQTFNGTWHLDVEKSNWGSVARPVSVVIVIDHHESQITYQGTVIYANEDTRSFGFAGAFDGKPYPMSRSYGAGAITLQRTDPYTFTSTFHSNDGLYTETSRTWVSRNGKTLRRQLTLRTPDATKHWLEVYRRQ